MATISTRTTGTKITATIWNDDLVAPINDYETRISAIEAGVLTAYSQTARQSVANTTTETTLATYTLAANWFNDGSNWNNMLKFSANLNLDNDSGGNLFWTIRIKLGSTTVWSVTTIGGGDGCSTGQNAYVSVSGSCNATAQSAQRWCGVAHVLNSIAAVPIAVSATEFINTTSAEDGSGALAFAITVELSAANPSGIGYLENMHLMGPIELKTS